MTDAPTTPDRGAVAHPEAPRAQYNPLLRIHPRWTALIAWLIVAGIMLHNYEAAIRLLAVGDSDDALRLVQVRDLINGQSWFDTAQYRINPPAGGMMHWSRLIDLPIALGIRFLMLFVEQPVAERFVLALYPMGLLGLLFAVVKVWLDRYASRPMTHIGLIVLATTTTMLFQFAPLRIDHHSWQIILAVVVMGFAVRRPTAVNGAWAGLFMANYLCISIEGAAYMVLFGAIFAFDWLRDPSRGARFAAYVGALALSSAAILAATRGLSTLVTSYCDAWSEPYLAATCMLAAVTVAGRALIGEATLARRIAILALAGGAGLIAFVQADAACLAGPFEALDPVVRKMWYQNIKEGLPIWDQSPLRIMQLVLTVVAGTIGTLAAWLAAHRAYSLGGGSVGGGSASTRLWRTTTFALIGATMIAIMVFRTISIAHLFAIPGIAWLIATLGVRARKLRRAPVRLVATLAVLMLLPLFLNSTTAKIMTRPAQPTAAVEVKPERGSKGDTLARVVYCFDGRSLDQLRSAPPSLLFAPLDVSPFLLAYTPHSVVATGHHRNQNAMRRVIDGFMLPPDRAKNVVQTSGARYLVICEKAPEFFNYRYRTPNGLAAALFRGDVPDWLVAIDPPMGSRIRIYRVRRPSARDER